MPLQKLHVIPKAGGRTAAHFQPRLGLAGPGAPSIPSRLGWLLLTLMAALSALPAVADAQDWRYRVRPGDTVWDLAHKYLRRDIEWQRLQAHNGIADPQRLEPGRVMAFPVAWLRRQPAPARVIAVSGDAQASRDGSFADAFAVEEGLRLGTGAALRTPADASLALEFADGSRLHLQGDSELHLDRLSAYGATGMVDTRLRLPRGRATSDVRRSRGPGSHYVVETPGMMSSVRGTQFRIGSDGARSRSEVVEGSVRVTGGGGDVLVSAGRGTLAGHDGRPLPPIALLPAPELSRLPTAIARMPAMLQWPALPGAAAYRVQASVHEDFRTLLQDAVAPTPGMALDVRAEGPLFLRVRGIDGSGLEGFDAATMVTVAAQPAPPFAIAPVAGGRVAGPRPHLRWTAAGTPSTRYRVQLALPDGFSAPLVSLEGLRQPEFRVSHDLAPGEYAWRVGATDADGRHGPWSDPVGFALDPAGEGPAIDAGNAEGALQVRWRAGDDSQRYRFQLSRSAAFDQIAMDRVLDDAAIALPGLRAGTWYMRVRTVDSDGYEHPFGPVQVVKVGCLPCRILAGAGGAVLLLLVL